MNDPVAPAGANSRTSAEEDFKKALAESVKKTWLVGPLLAWAVMHSPLAVVLLVLLIVVVIPLITPPLSALYVMGLRKVGFPDYGKFVVETFSEEVIKERVDQLVTDALERESVLVQQNNARLDFVQQLQQTWRAGGLNRSPLYEFPIQSPQEFTLEISGTKEPVADKKCLAASLEAINAEKALNSQVLAVSIMGRERFKWGLNDERTAKPFGENFWNALTSEEKDALLRHDEKPRLRLQLHLLPEAEPALKCYTLFSSLGIILTKSIPKPTRIGAVSPVIEATKGVTK